MRLVSRVRVVRGNGSDGLDTSDSADDALMNEIAGLDENDPRALGRFMRKMAQESGEDLGPEFDEVVGRLERGEDPEQIEKSMGDLFGDDMSGPAGMGLDDDYGSPAEDPAAKADKEAEEKDRKATEKRRTVPMKTKAKSQPRTGRSSKRSKPKGA